MKFVPLFKIDLLHVRNRRLLKHKNECALIRVRSRYNYACTYLRARIRIASSIVCSPIFAFVTLVSRRVSVDLVFQPHFSALRLRICTPTVSLEVRRVACAQGNRLSAQPCSCWTADSSVSLGNYLKPVWTSPLPPSIVFIGVRNDNFSLITVPVTT